MSQRSSSFEMLRIIAMLAIVLYHAATYTGALDIAYQNPWSINSALTIWLGAWGKTGINIFVLISGYFLCAKRFSWWRLAKLIGIVEFYALVVWVVLGFVGIRPYTAETFFGAIMVPFAGFNASFISSFLGLMLLSPLLNWCVVRLSIRQHLALMLVLLFVFSLLPTLGLSSLKFSIGEVPWYCVLYLMAAFVRMYNDVLSCSVRFWGWILMGALVMAALSMCCGAWANVYAPGKNLICWFVFPHWKILSVVVSISALMFFKNIAPRVSYSMIVNAVGTSTFAVYLLHDGVLEGNRALFWSKAMNVCKGTDCWRLLMVSVLVFIVAHIVDLGRRNGTRYLGTLFRLMHTKG